MIEIKKVKEHYEAYYNGKFIVSGDTYTEVIKELADLGYDEALDGQME